MIGPKTEFAKNLTQDRLCQPTEGFAASMGRIATALAPDMHSRVQLHEALLNQRFIPGERIQRYLGVRDDNIALSGVMSGEVFDNFGSALDRAEQAAEIFRAGGRVGIDFTELRPRGDRIFRGGNRSAGPVSIMSFFSAVRQCFSNVEPANGALTATLRIDHPDIMEFILAKQNVHGCDAFRTVVGVTDEFMTALANGKKFDLRWGGHVYSTVDPAEIWEMLMQSVWAWSEPQVLFLDTVNRRNSLGYKENITALSPVGEQPIAAFGSSVLGNLNLTKYLCVDNTEFDYYAFERDIHVAVRALDCALDVIHHPTDIHRLVKDRKRPIGLGVTGLANTIESLGAPYGSQEFLTWTVSLLSFLTNNAYRASIELSRELGPFDDLNRELFLKPGTFAAGLPEDIRHGIMRHGIRNSRLTCIYPCSLTSLAADNVSQGIEPVTDIMSRRVVNTPQGPLRVDVPDYGQLFLGTTPKVLADCTPEDHMEVFLAASRNVDGGVTKSIVVTPDTDWCDFQAIFVRAWEGGAKNCAVYQTESRRFGILQRPEDAAACYVDPKKPGRADDDE